MGLFGKKEIAEPVAIKEPAPAPEKPKGTVIAEGLTFIGDFVTDEDMDIRGRVQGNILSTVDVRISKTGSQTGSFNSRNLFSDGVLESDVVCTDTASFSGSASFKGTLLTSNFDSAHGSRFTGSLELRSGKSSDQPSAPGDDKSAGELAEDIPISEEDIFGKL